MVMLPSHEWIRGRPWAVRFIYCFPKALRRQGIWVLLLSVHSPTNLLNSLNIRFKGDDHLLRQRIWGKINAWMSKDTCSPKRKRPRKWGDVFTKEYCTWNPLRCPKLHTQHRLGGNSLFYFISKPPRRARNTSKTYLISRWLCLK